MSLSSNIVLEGEPNHGTILVRSAPATLRRGSVGGDHKSLINRIENIMIDRIDSVIHSFCVGMPEITRLMGLLM